MAAFVQAKASERNESDEALNEINHPPLIMCTRGVIQIKMASLVEGIQTASAVLSLPVANAARFAGPCLNGSVAGLRLHGIPPVKRHQRPRQSQ